MVKKHKALKLILVGDIALGDHPKSVGFGFYSKYKEGIPLSKAETLFPKVLKADIIFGNLEFNIGGSVLSGVDFSDLNCRGISQYADFLVKSGINVLNMANNHIFQHGREECDNTIKLLSDRGISLVGLKDEYGHNKFIKVGDQIIAFLGWSARPRQGFDGVPPYKEFEESECYKEIEETKSFADFICVSFHWGEEFIEIPSDEEKRIAKAMIDKGANVVVGHHPHVIREVEEYNGGVIAYSLGNFICDMTWNKATANTGLLYIDFSNGLIRDWKWFPGFIGKDYFPHCDKASTRKPVDGSTKKYCLLYDKLKRQSYNELAAKALSRHRRLTLFHMAKNFHKYSPKIVLDIILNAIKVRFSQKDCKDTK
jgi:poly-gamma-glutamate synthesis protein (capsule biosynthesis protein)